MSSILSPLQDNVSLWLPFSEGSGSTAYDYSGNSNDADIQGNCTYVKLPDGSYGINFTKTVGDVVDVNTQIVNDGTKSWTAGCWIRANSLSANMNIIAQSRWLLYYNNSGGTLGYGLYDGGWKIATKAFSSTDTWVRVIGVFDNNANTVDIYINGVVGTQVTGVGNISLLSEHTGIGSRVGGTDPFDGDIRLPFIIEGTVSQEWITKDYQETFIQ